MVLIMKEDREEARQAHESAKRNAVEKAQLPCICRAQWLALTAPRFRCGPRRTVAREKKFVYVLEANQLVLRASKNPHSDVVDHLGIWLGQGLTGWVGWHREPVAIPAKALQDPRFKRFRNPPEDSFEAFLSVPILCRSWWE